MSESDKDQFDQRFSLLEVQARKRRRTSFVVTLLLVGATAAIVMRFARDIAEKQAQVDHIEEKRVELDQKLRSEQEKLDAATKARKKLEAEVRQLEATKKNFEERILGDKGIETDDSKSNPGIETPTGAPPVSPTESQAAADAAAARALLIEEEGEAPQGLVITPKITVTPSRGFSGRAIFKVHLWLDIPASNASDVERVTYHLSPKHYITKRTIEAGDTPPFEAKFNVYACESTVLARVRLKSGAIMAVDFNWCDQEGWPDRKKEEVILAPEEEEKTPAKIPSLPPTKVPTSPPPTRNSEGGRQPR